IRGFHAAVGGLTTKVADVPIIPRPFHSSWLDFAGRLYQNDIMRLIGQAVLVGASRKHPDARAWLLSWAASVEDAEWRSLADVRDDYPSADGIKLRSRLVFTVFNVKGNDYR